MRRAFPAGDGQTHTPPPVTPPPPAVVHNPTPMEPITKAEGEVQPVMKPLPHPSGSQDHDSFISSCMSDLKSEFPDQKQRYAVCESQWSKSKTSKAATEVPPVPKHAGVMVALEVPEDIRKSLSVDNGLKAEELHLTLCYLGQLAKADGAQITTEDCVKLAKAVQNYAAKSQPLSGHIAGIGQFAASETSDNMDAVYASVDVPGLSQFRHELVKALEKDGLTISQIHDFTPHITLAYVAPDGPPMVKKVARTPVQFNKVFVAMGDEQHAFELGKTDIAKSVYIPIIKTEDANRLVTGLVLQPEVPDGQEDIISASEIRKAAHNFLAGYNLETKMGHQHKGFPEGITLVESWVAPIDLQLGEKFITKGTWLITTHVENDLLWQKVKKGEITGFSVGGFAKVQPLPATA